MQRTTVVVNSTPPKQTQKITRFLTHDVETEPEDEDGRFKKTCLARQIVALWRRMANKTGRLPIVMLPMIVFTVGLYFVCLHRISIVCREDMASTCHSDDDLCSTWSIAIAMSLFALSIEIVVWLIVKIRRDIKTM
jgi:hypothetical protein